MSQAEVAKAAGLSVPTIKRVESSREVSVSDAAIGKVQRALEAAGVIFVNENGEGPGVRLRKGKRK
jgi:DNA-binding LacI/PurR family transcriptional regulator